MCYNAINKIKKGGEKRMAKAKKPVVKKGKVAKMPKRPSVKTGKKPMMKKSMDEKQMKEKAKTMQDMMK